MYRESKRVSSLLITKNEMLNKYIIEEQVRTMERIRMKIAFMFAKIVTCFLLWHMIKYTGKLAVKFYVHLAYWLFMIPVLVCEALQFKEGNTIRKTRFICAGLLLRLLLSNFDFEGRMMGINYDLRVMSLTVNFLLAASWPCLCVCF